MTLLSTVSLQLYKVVIFILPSVLLAIQFAVQLSEFYPVERRFSVSFALILLCLLFSLASVNSVVIQPCKFLCCIATADRLLN